MEIEDLKTALYKEYTFSIKSEIGNKPTILNASKATNFIYKIDGIEEYEVDEIMKINKKTDKKWLKLRILKILEKVNMKNYNLSFHSIENEQFSKNLRLIDSNLPNILGQVLLYYYSGKITDIKSLTELLTDKNPLKLSEDEKNYFINLI
ncbi:MAG: HpaII family restriction endonuclease partial [Methanobrevibacter sp. CfCl-M3]